MSTSHFFNCFIKLAWVAGRDGTRLESVTRPNLKFENKLHHSLPSWQFLWRGPRNHK